jgi:hypothetical protein
MAAWLRLGSAVVLACLAPAAWAAPITGTVTVGPTCSGAQLDGPGCSQPLAGARLRLTDAAGATVAETSADTRGQFAFDAAPGRYVVQVVTQGKLPRCPPTDATAGGAALRIDCDSGRR